MRIWIVKEVGHHVVLHDDPLERQRRERRRLQIPEHAAVRANKYALPYANIKWFIH